MAAAGEGVEVTAEAIAPVVDGRYPDGTEDRPVTIPAVDLPVCGTCGRVHEEAFRDAIVDAAMDWQQSLDGTDAQRRGRCEVALLEAVWAYRRATAT